MKLEVRCCCNANILHGYLEVQGPNLIGEIIRFPLLELSEHLDFEIDLFRPSWIKPEGYLALKSKDYPIEKLRQIPGFEEVMNGNRTP